MKDDKRVLETVLYIINKIDVDFVVTSNHVDYSLKDIGLDSITMVYVILCIEKVFQIEIPDSFLISPNLNSINDIINVINKLKNF